MPPKSSSSSSAAGSQKQTSLLGFFGKAGQPPPARTSAASAGSSISSSQVNKKSDTGASVNGCNQSSSVEAGAGAVKSSANATNGALSSSKKATASAPATSAIDVDDDDDLSDAPSPEATVAAAPVTSSNASKNTPAASSSPTKASVESSPIKKSTTTVIPELSPPPSKRSSLLSSSSSAKMRGANDAGGAGVQRRTSTRRIQDSEDEDDAKDGVDAMQVDEEEADDSQEAIAARDDLHGSRRVSSRRSSTKRKIKYAESEDDEDGMDAAASPSDEGGAGKPRPAAAARTKSSSSGGGGRKKAKLEDDDDYEFDDAGLDDAAIAEAMSAYESSSPAKSAMVTDDDDDFADSPPPKASSKKRSAAAPAKGTFKAPARPPAKPLGNGVKGASGGGGNAPSGSGSGAGMFLTQAERTRMEQREAKKAEENCFRFLIDLKDKEGRRPDDPEYDPRTVFIPSSAWKEFTPFEKQFWEIKQNHFDTVLFFQKGKFYELYENDAEIGHNEFDLKLTDRVKMKMVGVPEMSFDFWAAKFLAAGYKVGKVEQAETAIGKEMRTKAGGAGEDKIVRRELASVLTNGTVVDEAFLSTDEASHCLAIKEELGEHGRSSFGICILDAATGQFDLTAFNDDVVCTKLETLLRQLRPKEIIHAKNNLSLNTLRVMRRILPMNTTWVPLRPGKEFYDEATARSQLKACFEVDGLMLPPAIVELSDNPLAIEAVGGMIFYLKSLNVADDLLSQRSFNVYDPIRRGETLVLDGQTLSHLEILMNNEGGEEGSLLQLLQRCVTPFGKRLFRIWLTVPLQNADAINNRLDAVTDLMDDHTFPEAFRKVAKGLPDLERLVSRIHAGHCKQSDFVKVVDAFSKIAKGFLNMAEKAESFRSRSVANLLASAPDLLPLVQHVQAMFVEENGSEQARSTETPALADHPLDILPAPGASAPCDAAVAAVQEAEGKLDALLAKYKKEVNCREMVFWHSPIGLKEIYQVQVPIKTKVPSQWTKIGGTKSLARYVTRETQPLIRVVQEARETRKIAFAGFYGELMQAFDADRETWLRAIRIFAELDCLLSLAKASADLDEPRCRPQFVESEEAFIDFRELRHPSMCLRSDFISNDVQLGDGLPRQTLLTGPNTAGKSTLCRMTAVGVIMAQLGCYVPASSARLSPIDKIHTRMGAYDNMFTSSSTFKVELDECAKILHEAGPKSLIILDELGRGTSTYDGMAIAEAVLHHFASHTLPIGFFATHYGLLTDDLAYHPNVRNMHMQTHADEEKKEVLPLYKLIPGRAESSYGTHVAHLAGVPDSVVGRADQVSKEFFEDFKQKLASRRKSSLPVLAQADFKWLVSMASVEQPSPSPASVSRQLELIRKAVSLYAK